MNIVWFLCNVVWSLYFDGPRTWNVPNVIARYLHYIVLGNIMQITVILINGTIFIDIFSCDAIDQNHHAYIYIYIYMGLGAGVAYLFFPQTAWQKIYYVYWCQFRGEFVNCNAKKGCILDTISTGFDLFFFLWLNISITF